jgi:hypothetical protein
MLADPSGGVRKATKNARDPSRGVRKATWNACDPLQRGQKGNEERFRPLQRGQRRQRRTLATPPEGSAKAPRAVGAASGTLESRSENAPPTQVGGSQFQVKRRSKPAPRWGRAPFVHVRPAREPSPNEGWALLSAPCCFLAKKLELTAPDFSRGCVLRPALWGASGWQAGSAPDGWQAGSAPDGLQEVFGLARGLAHGLEADA